MNLNLKTYCSDKFTVQIRKQPVQLFTYFDAVYWQHGHWDV